MSGWGCAREREQLGEGLELLAGHVAQLPAVHRRHGVIERRDERPPGFGDGGHDHSAIVSVAETSNEPPLLHSVQEAGYVGVPLDHAPGDVAAGRALAARTTQDAEHVELGEREIVGPEECRLGLEERVRGPEGTEEDFLLDARKRHVLPNLILQGAGHADRYTLQRI